MFFWPQESSKFNNSTVCIHSVGLEEMKRTCLLFQYLIWLRLLYQKCYRLGSLNSKHSFLTVLEAGKSKIKTLADLVSDESPLSGS